MLRSLPKIFPFIIAIFRFTIGFCSVFCINEVYSQPNWIWGKGIHTSSNEYSKDIAVDLNTGDVITVGVYNSSLASFYGNSFTGSTKGGFVAKYSSNGNVIWGFKLGSNNNNKCNGVAVDSSGSIYVVGSFDGTTDFRGLSATAVNLTSSGSSDAFIAKYNSSGQLVWVKKGGGNSDDEGRSVSINSATIFITGNYKNTATFGSFSTIANSSSQNVFITAYDYNGSLLWLSDAGSSQNSNGNDVYSDNTGVYLTGDFKGASLSIYNSSGVLAANLANTNSSKSDGFILALNNNGSYKWGGTVSSNEDDKANSITGSGSFLYITGSLKQSTFFPSYAGNPVAYSGGNMEMYVAGISKNTGVTQWVKREYGPNDDEGLGIATDGFGNVYVSGYYNTSISFAGGPTIISLGGSSEDIFVTSYSFTGVFQWVKYAGDDGLDKPYGIACNTVNEIYICGEYEKSPVFGSTTLIEDNGSNIFIAKIGCAEILNNSISASQSICVGSSASALIGTLPSGGIAPLTYKWEQSSDNSNWTSASGINNLQNYSPGSISATTYFRRRVYSSSVCYTTDLSNVITITVDKMPSTSIAGPDQTMCISSAGSLLLNANSPVVGTGAWTVISGTATLASPASPTSALNNVTAGNTVFVWSITNGVCPASIDTITIHVDALPTTSNAGPDKNVCSTSPSLTMNAISPINGAGVWALVSGTGNITSINSANSTVTNVGLGDNVFSWTTSNGVCPSSVSSVTIHSDLPPDSAFVGNDIITDIPFVQLTGNVPAIGTGHWYLLSGAGTFSSYTDPTGSISGLAVGSNIVKWEISNGACPSKKEEMIITMNPLRIPNGFSPNGDGRNDLYKVPGLEYYPGVKFKVFNKWGNIVYSNDEYKNEWEGKNNDNVLLVDDTYYFILEVMPEMEYSGFVIIKTN